MEPKEFSTSIKVRKVNNGMIKNPKMECIGDYWDEKPLERIT